MAVTAAQIAAWLRQQRERAGLSQAQAGARTGLNPDYISKWERGKGLMTENFLALVEAYGADISTLLDKPPVRHVITVAEPPPLPLHDATQEVEEVARGRGQKKNATRK